MVEPCIVPDAGLWDFINADYVSSADALGIYEYGGPTWYINTENMAMSWGRVATWGIMVAGFGSDGLKDISSKFVYHTRQTAE